MRNLPQANTPAVFRAIKSGVFRGEKIGDVWVIKQNNSPYSQNGLFMRSSRAQPIYCYTKNYKKWSKDYCLFMWTPEEDIKKVEKFLDSVKVKREDIIEVVNKVRAYKYVEPRLV